MLRPGDAKGVSGRCGSSATSTDVSDPLFEAAGHGGKCGLKSSPISSPDPSGGVGRRAYGPRIATISTWLNAGKLLSGSLPLEPELEARERGSVEGWDIVRNVGVRGRPPSEDRRRGPVFAISA
jgi:hypothetical protein